MLTSDFSYDLPETLIAQYPPTQRDVSRMLYLGPGNALTDSVFKKLPDYLEPGDLIVLNDTQVIPARLFAKKETGGKVEIMLERIQDDKTLLVQLRARFPDFEYHASTLAHLTNSAAVRFYAEQGITRAVFPRHLTIAEMETMASKLPEIRFDAFMLVGKCANTEGLCSFHHSSPDKIWPCEISYTIAPGNLPASASLQRAIDRQASWSRSNRRHGCGLCALPELMRIGLHGVKLVGRGAATALKIRNVKLVKEFINLAAAETDGNAFRRRARAAHQASFGSPCCRNVCYYPEFLNEQ